MCCAHCGTILVNQSLPSMLLASAFKIPSIAWYHAAFIVTVWFSSSKKYGPVIPKADTPCQILTFEWCRDFSNTWPGCSSLQYRKFCLFTYLERWKCASSDIISLKNTSVCIQHSHEVPAEAIMASLSLSSSCWPFGFCMGESRGHCAEYSTNLCPLHCSYPVKYIIV